MAIANFMRDQFYPNRTIRISDEVWQALKDKRVLSNKSWNLFLRGLAGIKPKKPKEKNLITNNQKNQNETTMARGITR